jgi:hypothetical protein
MAKKLKADTAAKLRADARALEAHADSSKRYPSGTVVRRGQGPSRMFNIRLGRAVPRPRRRRTRQAPPHLDDGPGMAAGPTRP